MTQPILSHYQARVLLEARARGLAEAPVSLDLELTRGPARLHAEAVDLAPEVSLDWAQVESIAADEKHCYVVQAGRARPVQAYSERQQRFHSLYPTRGAPTMLLAGFPMHRIKGTDPHADTLSKVRALGPPGGWVLDTCLGLGYTAIELARTASWVLAVELDPVTLDIARQNPWSQALFTAPNVQCVVADALDLLPALPARCFSAILHDPPTFSLAGELYSGAFYAELRRVLKDRGRLFHYIGDLDSKSGAQVARGAARRLKAAGFARVTPRPEAFGLLAEK